jgi:thymidylate synthase ThyX
VLPLASAAESYTADERDRLAPYFTNLDGHVFALTNLPETVKAALFARYSRTAKPLRRLFLDEFADKIADRTDSRPAAPDGVGMARAEKLFARVFNEYGDDSVAQLGGAHIACEYVSNVLTKVLEWGRLMAYLEQSTRYVPYTDKLHGRWRYHLPAELSGSLRSRYVRTMDEGFETYARLIDPMQRYFAARYPKAPQDSEAVHRAATRAKALDTLRGMLPAATQSNVGIFGTGRCSSACGRIRCSKYASARTRCCGSSAR